MNRIKSLIFLIILVSSILASKIEVTSGVEDSAEEVIIDQSKIRWVQTNGPPGGKMFKLIQNPKHHNELFLLSTSGIWKSIDRGESWEYMNKSKNITTFSMAIYEDKLFFCGNGVYYYDYEGNLVKILENYWNRVFVCEDKLFVCAAGGRRVKILYTDLTSEYFDWVDISPPESVLRDIVPQLEDPSLLHEMMVFNMVTIDEKIFVNIIMIVEGSGEYTNGHLYISEDLGESWSEADLGVQRGLLISKIIQDPNNKEHIILSFKHRLHDTYLPLSELLLESFNGGLTWDSVTDITIEANHVGDIDFIDSSYYITLAAGWSIIKLNENGYELIDMPIAEGYDPKIVFTLIEILFDLDDPQIVYGRTNDLWSLGLVKSEDGMQTWRKIDEDIIASPVSIVVVHPYNTEIIFTSGNTAHEAYITKDGGETWEPYSYTTFGDELRFDSHNPDHIILIDEMSQIFESFDLGETWTNINNNFSSARIFDFEITDEGIIYASNTGVGLSKQVYGDIEWQYLLSSPDYVYDFEIDPEDSNILYASYSPKIFENHSSIWRYSTYQAENDGWSEKFRIENTSGITAIEFDRSNSDTIYAGVVGSKGMIISSYNGGEDWQRLSENFTFVTIHEMAIDPKDEDTVYAAPWGGGLFKSTDKGKSWMELKVPTISIASIIVDPSDSNHLIIGDRIRPKIFESRDQGESWSELVCLSEEKYYRISSMIMHQESLYFSVLNRMEGFISLFTEESISGTVFKLVENELTQVSGDIKRCVLNFFSDNEDLYAICHIRDIYKFEGGEWREISASLPDMGFNNIIVVDDDIYAAGGCDVGLKGEERIADDNIVNEIYRSSDNGETWTALLGDNPFSSGIKKLLHHPSNRDLFFAGTGTGLYVSPDRGVSWSEENDGLDFRNIGSMVVGENYVYVGTLGGGVYTGIINSDYSVNWLNSKGPYPVIHNIQMRVDPTNSSIIYSSSYPGGVFKSSDGGRKWIESNFALPSFEVDDPNLQGYYSLEIDPNDPNILYLGVFGKGLYKSTDGGAVWIPMYGRRGQNMEIMSSGIREIRVDPTNYENLYLASDNGVFYSRDAGENWAEINDGLRTLDIKSIRVNSIPGSTFEYDFEDWDTTGWQLEEPHWSLIEENTNILLQGVGHHWATTGLESWGDYTIGFRLKPIQGGIHINFRMQHDEGRYYLGLHEDGLYLEKQFNRWSEFATLIDKVETFNRNQWYDLKIQLEGGLIKIYIDGELKIEYRDPDPLLYGAIGFESLDESQIHIDDITLTTDPTSEIYVGTGGYGIYRYDCHQGEWENLGRTIGTGWWHVWDRRMYQFCSLRFDPVIPGKIYLGVFPSGFFISEDNGHTWRDSSLGLGNDGMFSMTIHPNNTDILWAGTYNGVAKSVDGGETWVFKSNGWPSEQWPYMVLIDDEDTDIMYSTSKNGQNKGFCHRNSFCGVVMKSTNGGENWFPIMNGLDNRSEFYNLIFHPMDHEILFMSTSKGVYMSIDAGNKWTGINKGLTTTDNWVRDNVADNLALTPDGKYLVLGTMDFGVWKLDLSKAIVINKTPIASFTYSPDEPTTKDDIGFHDSSEDPEGAITQWEWDFGDGSNSNEQNPIHRYDEEATYTVTLKVTDNYGLSDTVSKNLMIELGQPSIDSSIIITGAGFAIIIILIVIIKRR